MALPDFDRRATITTVPTSESFLDGIMPVESSSRNVKGKSFFVARTMATGIGGPFTSRANTNNVSVADPLPARLGPIITLPVIASDCPACPAGAVGSVYAGTVATSSTLQTSRPHLSQNLSAMYNAPLLRHFLWSRVSSLLRVQRTCISTYIRKCQGGLYNKFHG